jgi:hypothetical protein
MSEKSLIPWIRRCSLWAILGSAPLLVIISVLNTWNVISTTEESSFGDMMSGSFFGEPNAWGKTQSSLGIILALSFVTLLAILVSSKTTLGKVAAAPAKVETGSVTTAKATPAKKAVAKPKK